MSKTEEEIEEILRIDEPPRSDSPVDVGLHEEDRGGAETPFDEDPTPLVKEGKGRKRARRGRSTKRHRSTKKHRRTHRKHRTMKRRH